MIVEFNNVTPLPLDGVIDFNTDIWDKRFVIDSGFNSKIYAPSGKGKSTFMHIIYGLRNDYKGNVKIDSKDVKDFTLDDWAVLRQERISMVFQDLRLFLGLTALENIKLKHALNPQMDFEKLEEYFEKLQIGHVKNKLCGRLSYGERQRVAIIRALTQPFQLLLLDEPFSHLDPFNASVATEIILKECQLRNAGFLFTSLGADSYLKEDKMFRL